jgi:protein TonB
MNSKKMNVPRIISFTFVGVVHVVLLFVIVFQTKGSTVSIEKPPAVFQVVDIDEELPPPPPPPPEYIPPAPVTNTVEAAAEQFIEADEIPENLVVVDYIPVYAEPAPPAAPAETVYLPQKDAKVPPKFNDREIRKGLVYPAIALRGGVEGTVYLELFVDAEGIVQKITIMKEDPKDRGFGDAAIKAFTGLRGEGAKDKDGNPIAVRYRYPVKFKIN